MHLKDDPSLDLAQAADLLKLLYFVFEHADNERDWHAMRGSVGGGLMLAERAVATSLRKVETTPFEFTRGLHS